MTHAIRIHQTGGPEALAWDEVELGAPGPGEVLLKQSAVGLNFIDVYHRTGLYPLAELPAVIGMEGAGQITAVGEGITDLKPGDRVVVRPEFADSEAAMGTQLEAIAEAVL